jgi:hypothetical protein
MTQRKYLEVGLGDCGRPLHGLLQDHPTACSEVLYDALEVGETNFQQPEVSISGVL